MAAEEHAVPLMTVREHLVEQEVSLQMTLMALEWQLLVEKVGSWSAIYGLAQGADGIRPATGL